MSLRVELAHRQIFDEPAFDLFEIVMVAIQDLLRLIEIDIVLGYFRPGKFRDRFEVSNYDRIFRTGRRDEIEPFQFALGLRQDVSRRFRLFEPGAQLSDLLIGASLAFTQFLLDGLELLAQIGFALCIGKLRRDVFLQLLLDLRDLELRGDMGLHRA